MGPVSGTPTNMLYRSLPVYAKLCIYISNAFMKIVNAVKIEFQHKLPVARHKPATRVVCCRSQRLQFDVSSPNGILLFREISKVIVGYGEHA